MDLQLLRAYAISLVGTPYLWGQAPSGGDDPIGGFDCSGLASELARAGGLVPWNYRKSAQGLYDDFSKLYRSAPFPQLGDFLFYGLANSKIDHVAFALDPYTIIESGGGDSTTLGPEIAAKQNAFVRFRPWNYRRHSPFIIRPLYPVVLNRPENG